MPRIMALHFPSSRDQVPFLLFPHSLESRSLASFASERAREREEGAVNLSLKTFSLNITLPESVQDLSSRERILGALCSHFLVGWGEKNPSMSRAFLRSGDSSELSDLLVEQFGMIMSSPIFCRGRSYHWYHFIFLRLHYFRGKKRPSSYRIFRLRPRRHKLAH